MSGVTQPSTAAAGPHAQSTDDAGLAALVLIARFHGIATNAEQIRHLAAIGGDKFSEAELILSARNLGLKARAVPVHASRFSRTPFPALLLDANGKHFIVAGSDGKTALVLEPSMKAPAVKTIEEVTARPRRQNRCRVA